MFVVSVIMPAYNCERYIEKAIDSILNQTWQNFELLIADDCSNDNTKQIISAYEKKDPRIKIFANDENLGYLRTTNLLFDRCVGDFITFQDADDWSVPNRLETLLNAFKDDETLGCAGSFVQRVDENENGLKELSFETSYDKILNDLPYCFNCIGSTLMIKRGVYTKCGGYHPYFDRIGSEDLYWFGTISNNFKTINIPIALYNYRDTTGSISNELSKSIRKQASKEMATEGMLYYSQKREHLFDKKLALARVEMLVFGKYYCWNKKYRKGVAMLLLSMIIFPQRARETGNLIKVYLPKVRLG